MDRNAMDNIVGDELISVTSLRLSDGTEKTLTFKTSSLKRSPCLIPFFESDDYLYGCKMHLKFKDEPAECFEIVQQYLDLGPDRYTAQSIRLHMGLRYSANDGFVILVKLYSLAGKLHLPGLQKITYECIKQMEPQMQAGFCLTLTPLIYDKKARFDKRLQRWCFKQISTHYQVLCGFEEWAELLGKLDSGLAAQWRELVKANGSNKTAVWWSDLVNANGSIETAVGGQDPPAALERIVSHMPTSSQENLVSSLEARLKDITASNAAASAAAPVGEAAMAGNMEKMRKMGEQNEDGWEDFESMRFVSSKVCDVLGIGSHGEANSQLSKDGKGSASAKHKAWPFGKGKDKSKPAEGAKVEEELEAAMEAGVELEAGSAAGTAIGTGVEAEAGASTSEAAPRLLKRKPRMFKSGESQNELM